MNSYVVFNNGGEVACKRIGPHGDECILTKIEFLKVVKAFTSRDYRVNMGSYSIILDGGNLVIKICDFREIIDAPILAYLKAHIETTIGKQGFTNISAIKNVAREPNVEKSNKFGGALIKIVSGLALVAVLAGISLPNVVSEAEVIRSLKASNSKMLEIGSSNNMGNQMPNALSEQFRKIKEETSEKSYGEEFIEEDNLLSIAKSEAQERAQTVFLEFEQLSNTDKAATAKELYYDTICKYAKALGLDEDMLLGMAIQERGLHSSTEDSGGVLGLMQIKYDVWVNQTVAYYELNEATGQFEKRECVLTDEMLRDVDGNIKAGAIILQASLRTAKYNIPAAIQMYNQGSGAVKSIITAYASDIGATYEEVLANPDDLGWLNYRYLRKGDDEYIENINKWISDHNFQVINVYNSTAVEFDFTDVSYKKM